MPVEPDLEDGIWVLERRSIHDPVRHRTDVGER